MTERAAETVIEFVHFESNHGELLRLTARVLRDKERPLYLHLDVWQDDPGSSDSIAIPTYAERHGA